MEHFKLRNNALPSSLFPSLTLNYAQEMAMKKLYQYLQFKTSLQSHQRLLEIAD